jgi:16S rRNA (guanine966-N2)-methyltransferase
VSNSIRITAGRLRGRHIHLLKESNARYTSSMVREAIFNALGTVEGAKVLDLYAGAGSFTIEALSRGAAASTCVEIDRSMAVALEENIALLGLSGDCEVLNMDVQKAIPFLYGKERTYDIIFLDPPYGKGMISETLSLLKRHGLHHGQTLFILEHARKELPGADQLIGWDEIRSKRYGCTIVTILSATKEECKGVQQ